MKFCFKALIYNYETICRVNFLSLRIKYNKAKLKIT